MKKSRGLQLHTSLGIREVAPYHGFKVWLSLSNVSRTRRAVAIAALNAENARFVHVRLTPQNTSGALGKEWQLGLVGRFEVAHPGDGYDFRNVGAGTDPYELPDSIWA